MWVFQGLEGRRRAIDPSCFLLSFLPFCSLPCSPSSSSSSFHPPSCTPPKPHPPPLLLLLLLSILRLHYLHHARLVHRGEAAGAASARVGHGAARRAPVHPDAAAVQQQARRSRPPLGARARRPRSEEHARVPRGYGRGLQREERGRQRLRRPERAAKGACARFCSCSVCGLEVGPRSPARRSARSRPPTRDVAAGRA